MREGRNDWMNKHMNCWSPDCRNLISSPAPRARMPELLSYHTSLSDLFSSASVFSLFIFLKERRDPFSIPIHPLSRNPLLLIFLGSWFSNALPSSIFSLSIAPSPQHVKRLKCFRSLEPPSHLAAECSYLPLHFHLVTYNPKAVFQPRWNIWPSILVHFSFLILCPFCLFVWISIYSLTRSVPPRLSSSISSSGKPSETPTEELVISPFCNFTEYQMRCDYLLADLPPPSNSGILVSRFKILLIICVFPVTDCSRSWML